MTMRARAASIAASAVLLPVALGMMLCCSERNDASEQDVSTASTDSSHGTSTISCGPEHGLGFTKGQSASILRELLWQRCLKRKDLREPEGIPYLTEVERGAFVAVIDLKSKVRPSYGRMGQIADVLVELSSYEFASPFRLGPGNFSLVCGSGNEYPGRLSRRSPPLAPTMAKPGAPRRGWVSFWIPAEQNATRCSLRPDFGRHSTSHLVQLNNRELALPADRQLSIRQQLSTAFKRLNASGKECWPGTTGTKRQP